MHSLSLVEVREVRADYLPPINHSGAAAAFVRSLLSGRDREALVAVHLDARNQPTSMELVSLGSLTASIVHPREVFKAAILSNAASVILAHNHPSGSLAPSAEDWAITDRLRNAGGILGIDVVDHVIVTDSGFLSMLEEPRWNAVGGTH